MLSRCFSIACAKVLLFFVLCKFFPIFLQKNIIISDFVPQLEKKDVFVHAIREKVLTLQSVNAVLRSHGV